MTRLSFIVCNLSLITGMSQYLVFSSFPGSQAFIVIPPLIERGLYCNHLVCPFFHPFFRPFTFSKQISQLLLEEMILFWIYGFGIVTCTVSPLSRLTAHLLPDLFTVWLRIFHVCRNENFRNRYVSFYWKK